MSTTTARNYYEQYTDTDAVALLQSLPAANPRVFENEWLDFKSGRAVNDPDNLARIWSKTVGAFTNNEGGVLIFGIEADKDKSTGIDCANAIELVPDVNWLISKLTELSRFATDPPSTGIEYKALPLNDSSAEGFVVCLVPEGKVKPYRAEKADKRFYLRMGDSAKEPSVALLRQLFYPQFKTKALLKMRAEHAGGSEKRILHLSCLFINIGSSTIEQGVLDINTTDLHIFAQPSCFPGSEYTGQGLPPYFHPSQKLTINLYMQAAGGGRYNSFKFTLYQRHCEAINQTYTVDFIYGDFVVGDNESRTVETVFAPDYSSSTD